MVHLHAQSLSPDPTYGFPASPLSNNRSGMDIFPHRLLRIYPEQPVEAWASKLNLFRPPGILSLQPSVAGRAEILLDFGTEIDAALEIEVELTALANLAVWFGESPEEAEGWVQGTEPLARMSQHFANAGRHTTTFETRGFRFVRLAWHDLSGPVGLLKIVAHAQFSFRERRGDFWCDDQRFQRVWQSSVYTARLCTRPDTFWDGIKRDRVGWYGDARITQQTIDLTFFDPAPSESMLPQLPTESWGNEVPIYSFDAVAMLHRHVLNYGLGSPAVTETFARVEALFDWVASTQTNDEGFIIRDPHQKYFFDIGFVDWSEMPSGGRFEELCWLQGRYVEGLRLGSTVAQWLQRFDLAERWSALADTLSRRITDWFWREGRGFVHTLNHVGPVRNPHVPGYGDHYRKTYIEGIQLGESGASRQANAIAVMAGIVSKEQHQTILNQVFDNAQISPVITPYFSFFEQTARALCGDAQVGLEIIRDTVGRMLENEDAATVWELYDPQIKDLRRLSSHFELDWEWPMSLCHSWGSGSVGYAARWVLGLEVHSSGFRHISLRPECGLDWQIEATVPSPHGLLHFERAAPDKRLRVIVPPQIEILASNENTIIERNSS